MLENQNLVDRIYEAAFLADGWDRVCVMLSEAVQGYSTSLITLNESNTFNWVSSPNVRDDMLRFSESPLRFQNVRPARHAAMSPFSFMRDIDLMTEEEIARDPIYTEFLYPRGLGWTVGDMFREPSGHTVIFDIIRRTTLGPFDTKDVDYLNALRPHLARAATISSRLQFERINAAVQALELIGVPAAVITSTGKVLGANASLQTHAPQVIIATHDRLRFDQQDISRKFSDTLGKAMADGVPASCSLPLRATETHDRAVVHLIPISGNARDIFVHAAYFVVVTIADRSKIIQSETIQGLFDLTPSEARVARSLAVGNDVAATALNFGLSAATVRVHLKSVLAKCGMTRQADLIATIASLSPFASPDD